VGWALAVIAATLIVYAVVSRGLRGTPITAAIFFVAVGLVFGPKVSDVVDPAAYGEPVKALAELTLTLILFTDASRIDISGLRAEYAIPARLLAIGLPLTIAAGAAVAAADFTSLNWTEALVLGVVLAPTDAALGQAVVTDPRVPSRIRQGLNVESGLNDGICVPILFIAIALADAEAGNFGVGPALRLVFEAIGYGVLGGAIGGAVTALAVRLALRYRTIDPTWLQVVVPAGAALAYGIANPLGGSGFIAAFVGGAVFGRMHRRSGVEVTYFAEQLGGLLNALTLFVFGAVLLGPALGQLSWRTALYTALSLTAVRMLPVALALLGTGARRPTALFTGWFGPRGLASIVFAVIIVEQADFPHAGTIVLATLLTVGVSVLAHGLSAAPLTARYVRWYEAHARDEEPAMESRPVPDQRWRVPVSSTPSSAPRRIDR
jgi:sodium/hydrogen antiporter